MPFVRGLESSPDVMFVNVGFPSPITEEAALRGGEWVPLSQAGFSFNKSTVDKFFPVCPPLHTRVANGGRIFSEWKSFSRVLLLTSRCSSCALILSKMKSHILRMRKVASPHLYLSCFFFGIAFCTLCIVYVLSACFADVCVFCFCSCCLLLVVCLFFVCVLVCIYVRVYEYVHVCARVCVCVFE